MQTQLSVASTAYEQRLRRRKASRCGQLWTLLDRLSDPEIPVLSLWDLGVLSDIEETEELVSVTISPTYSGCPAMDTIRSDIEALLHSAGIDRVEIKTQLSPAWSSNWLSPEGRTRLADYGIAPPNSCDTCGAGESALACPRCGSLDTRLISEFGSTACKALFQCQACLEPFDYFKPL